MHMDNLKIYGFSANIDSVGNVLSKINEIKKDEEIIQLMDADAIASKNHVVHGVNHAVAAFDRGENIAKDLGVEVLLRCSAQRQISKAFKILGLSEGDMNLCAVLINCDDDYVEELESLFTRDDDVLDGDDDKLKEIYAITDIEAENMSVENIIIDRISKLIVDY